MPTFRAKIVLATLALVPCTIAPVAAPAAPDGRPPKLALLIGIGKYRHLPALEGADNDVAAVRDLLVSTYGFAGDDIEKLQGPAAHREAILDAFERLIRRATPMTKVVIYYSGHGSQLSDDDPHEEPDRLDETIVPYDSGRRPHRNLDITDDTIGAFLDHLTALTPDVTLIFDSCHCGTVTRGWGARSVRADLRPPPPHPQRWWMKRASPPDGPGLRRSGARYVALFASGADQKAYEHSYQGEAFGAFTWHLVRELRRAARSGAVLTYRDLMAIVSAQVRVDVRRQTPRAEGANLDRVVFGLQSRRAPPFAPTNPIDARTVRVDIGRVHGATPGSRYEVYPPATRAFVSGRGVMAVLTQVGISRSIARLDAPGPIAPGSRAVARTHRRATAPIRVRLVGLDRAALLPRVRARLAELDARGTPIARVVPSGVSELTLRETGGRVRIERASQPTDGRLAAPPVAVDADDALERVVGYIEHWSRWYDVRLISAPPISAYEDVGIRLRSTAPDRPLRPGETFELSVENTSRRRRLYVHLLSLSSDGSIDVVFPKGEAPEVVVPGRAIRKRLCAELPPGLRRVDDVLKVFVTTVPVDFGPLAMPGLFGAPEARRDRRGPGRGGRLRGPGPQRPASDIWRTASTVVSIER